MSVAVAALWLTGCPAPAVVRAPAAAPAPAPSSQNPSPMVETTRTHERLSQRGAGGEVRTFSGPAGRPVSIWLPAATSLKDEVDVVIHFHGAAWLPQQSVAALRRPFVGAVVNLGSGSRAYHQAFADPSAFDSLLHDLLGEIAAVRGRPTRIGRVALTAFSAGHGAIRVILREPRHFEQVHAVLLLDGMHTSYMPEGGVLATGALLDSANLLVFAELARSATRGEKRFVVTHSEIFPGTFASTTETADWLLQALGMKRTAVLRWGPRGMQQLSEVRAGGFELLGYAGNSAPDHVDHLHAMPELLGRLLEP